MVGKFVRKFLIVFIGIFLLSIVLAVAVFIYAEAQLPDVEKLKDAHLQVPLRVYSADNKLIAQFGAKRRIPVPLSDVPKDLINAILATEDARFYSHPGVDFVGIARATVAVVATGRKVQGASTITMQVARNFYLSREKTYVRKVKEILLALKIDRELPKDKILELYLNKIYFGNRAYGVAAAAAVYYGKKLNELTLGEMAMLAGLPQAPSRNNPLENSAAALKRRDHVLMRMKDVGFITEEQYKKAILEPNTAKYHSSKVQVNAPYLAEMVREAMIEEYGDSAYEKGLSVYTTLDSRLQHAAVKALRDGLSAYDRRHGFRKALQNLSSDDSTQWAAELGKLYQSPRLIPAAIVELSPETVKAVLADGNVVTVPWSGLAWAKPELDGGGVGETPKSPADIVKYGDVVYLTKSTNQEWQLTEMPEVQGAIVSLNPQNGAVLALSGGYDYSLSNFNRAIQAERQPGSNFKPFIYSSAFNKGYTLASIVNDAPIVQQDTGENQVWRPMNDTLKFYGPTPLREGLSLSRNLVSIRLLQSVGVPYALDYIKRFGFDTDALPHSLSLALGTGLVTPMQMAVGYSVFANGGSLVTPYFIKKIVDQHGEVLYDVDPARACFECLSGQIPTGNLHFAPRVITPQNCYLMYQAMRDVIQNGTGRGALVLKRSDLAGKTGTSQEYADAWFSGFTSQIETTVWVGFDNMKSVREYGAAAALPIWIDFMRVALQNIPEQPLPEPPGIVTMRIDPHTGFLAGPNDPNARFEIFEQKYAPRHHTSVAGNSGGTEDEDHGASEDQQLF